MTKFSVHFAFYLFVMLMQACAIQSALTPDKIIGQRVQARWDALIGNNWPEAYRYETPGYKATHTVEQFQGKFGQALKWKTVKIESIKVDPGKQKASVSLNVAFDAVIPNFGLQTSTSYLTETWLLEGDEWWHYSQ
jgi:hypothetical protein